jgi:hypothetical protein
MGVEMWLYLYLLCFVAAALALAACRCFIAWLGQPGLTFLLDEKSKQKNQDAPNSLNARTVERHKVHLAQAVALKNCCKLVLLYLPAIPPATLLILR